MGEWGEWGFRGVGVGVAVLAAGLLALSLRGPTPRASATPVRCERAVFIDGLLRCDEAIPSLSELCGRDLDGRLRGGDAVEPARLCQLDTPHPGGPGWSRMPPDQLEALAQPVNINDAPLPELQSLPGIGPALGQRIIDARPLEDEVDLDAVKGIGPKTLERLRPRIVYE